MANQVTILVNGQPLTVNEVRPGLFGELGYEYASGGPTSPTAPTTPTQPSQPASTYTGVSIVDYLKSVGQSSDYSSRSALAAQQGIQNYQGTAEQNTQLLNILRGGGTVAGGAQTSYKEGDTRDNPITGQTERYMPDGTWKEVSTAGNKRPDTGFVGTSDTVRDAEKAASAEALKQVAEDMLKDQTEIEKLTTQQQLQNIRTELGLDPQTGLVKPVAPSYESDFLALRSEHGITAIETQMNDLKSQIRTLEATARTEIEKEETRLAPGESIGIRQSALQKEANRQIDELNRRLQTLTDEYNTKANLINTMMSLKQLDYQTASDEYNRDFSMTLQLMNLVEGRITREQQEETREKDDARANLTLLTNLMDSSNLKWDDLDFDMQAQMTALEIKGNLPVGITSMFMNSYPQAELLTSVTGTDASGQQVVSFIYKDENGMPGIVQTVQTGLMKQPSAADTKSLQKQSEISSMNDFIAANPNAPREQLYNEILQNTEELGSTDINSALDAAGIAKSQQASMYLSDSQLKAAAEGLVSSMGINEAIKSIQFGKINRKDKDTEKITSITLSNEQKNTMLNYVNSIASKKQFEYDRWKAIVEADPTRYLVLEDGIYEKNWIGKKGKLVYSFK